MNVNDRAVGEIVLIGRAAYQLYAHTYRGALYYRATVGKPWTDKQNGVTRVLPFMQDDSTRDFLEAATEAARQLEAFRAAAFREQVHSSAASISPLERSGTSKQDEALPAVNLKLANG